VRCGRGPPDQPTRPQSGLPRDLAALDVPTEPNHEDGRLGAARYCEWQKPSSDAPGHTIGVGIFDDLSIDEVVSEDEPVALKVGSHEAVQHRGTLGTYGVSIQVTESSLVDVLGTAQGNFKRGCKFAKEAAKLVEQHLP
jgi:hypothetical protein